MARSLLAGERATLTGSGYARHCKLEVQNGSGTWKNVGDLLGVDYVIDGGWGEDMDQPVGTASFRIQRRQGAVSLSPLMAGSVLNVDDDGLYSPLLEKGRAWRAWSATIPNGATPVSSDYREGMQGRIDTVQESETGPIVIDCSDLGVWLADTQITTEGVEYGTVGGTPLADVLQAIVNDWPSGKLSPAQSTVYANTTNNFAVTSWAQGEAKVLDGTRNLVQQSTADDFRFRYDAAHQFRLTLFDPQRGRTSVDWTLGPEEYYPIRRLSSGIVDIRTFGSLDYPGGTVTSPADPDTDPSVLAYGRRDFRLPQSGAITTALQAQTLLDIVVEDLNDGPLDQETTLPMFWPVQLYDRITFLANGSQYDEDQTFMVAGYRHEFDGLGAATTTLRLGGKVVGAYADWLRGIRTRRTTIETYNQCLAQVTDSDGTTVEVTVTASSPAGTPTVEYVGVTGSATKASGPAIGVASASGTVWVFTRGAAGGGIGQAQFHAVFPGNVSDDDFATIPEQAPVLQFTQVLAAITASDATTETVTVTATPSGATVELVSVTGTATKASGPNVGVASASGTVWVFNRGAALGGDGQAQFRAVLTGYQSDDDLVLIPQQGTSVVMALLARARVTGNTATTLTVRVAVADPSPGANATISYQNQGTGGVSPSSGGTVTPVSTLTEAAGTYIDYTITRPAFGTGAGRVTFTVTEGGRVADVDAVDVPEADRDTVFLASRARVLASDATTVTVRYAVADPYPQGANSVTLTYQSQGTGGVSPGSGGTITPAATIGGSETAGTYIDYVITRAAFGAGAGRVTFTATAANRVSDSDAVDVEAVQQDTITPILTLTPFVPSTPYGPATQQAFIATATNPGGSTTPLMFVLLSGTTGHTGTGVVIADGVEHFISIADNFIYIDRAPFSTTTQVTANFRATLAGGGEAVTQRSIDNQVKAAFGPSLQLNLTIGPTSCSIAYVVIGTLEVSIDGGTWATAGASPITGITRNSSPHTYDFRAFADSRYAPGSVAIPAITAPVSPFTGVSLGSQNNTFDTVTASWTWTGDSSAAFEVWFSENNAAFVYQTTTAAGATSSVINSNFNLTPTGTSLPMKVYLVAVLGSNALAQSSTTSFTATRT